MTPGVCRGCGCTNERACMLFAGPTGPRRLSEYEAANGVIVDLQLQLTDLQLQAFSFPCCWIEPDLCSACLEPPAPAPLLYDALGLPMLRGAP